MNRVRTALAALLASAPPVLAQLLPIEPVIQVQEGWSDNVALARSAAEREGFITDVTGGIRLDHSAPRVRVHIDARIHFVEYEKVAQAGRMQRFLDALVTVEPVEKWLYLDARATRTQQNRSPFGFLVAPDATSASANRVETQVEQVAPYVNGQLGDVARYQARHVESVVATSDATLPRTRIGESSFRARNATASARLGWSVDAAALRLENDVVGTREDQRLRGSLVYEAFGDVHLFLGTGYESTDFTGATRRSGSTPAAGIAWNPGPRTRLFGEYERRFFGRGHEVSFSHRTALTAWRLRSTRDATILPHVLGSRAGEARAAWGDLLIASISDPEERERAARRMMEEAALPVASVLDSGFLATRPFEFREVEASVAYRGPRDLLTGAYTHRVKHAFDLAFSAAPPVAGDANVRQDGWQLAWAHRMTPLTTLTGNFSAVRTEELAPGTRHARQRQAGLALATRLSPTTTASFILRRTLFEGDGANDFRENAAFALLSLRP